MNLHHGLVGEVGVTTGVFTQPTRAKRPADDGSAMRKRPKRIRVPHVVASRGGEEADPGVGHGVMAATLGQTDGEVHLPKAAAEGGDANGPMATGQSGCLPVKRRGRVRHQHNT